MTLCHSRPHHAAKGTWCDHQVGTLCDKKVGLCDKLREQLLLLSKCCMGHSDALQLLEAFEEKHHFDSTCNRLHSLGDSKFLVTVNYVCHIKNRIGHVHKTLDKIYNHLCIEV